MVSAPPCYLHFIPLPSEKQKNVQLKTDGSAKRYTDRRGENVCLFELS
jgi:hypothetical protein